MEQLVVRVGTGPGATYFLIERERRGVTIDLKPRDFLAGLSQGRAHFEETPVTGADVVDGDGIEMLKFVEPLYVYAAFCGFALSGMCESDVVSHCHDCLDAVDEALSSLRAGEVNEVQLGDVDALVLDLLARLAGNRANAAGEWETDQKIVAMYSRDVDVNIPH